MPYNPKSLENLKHFKKGEKKSKEEKEKIAKTKLQKKNMQEVAKGILNNGLSPETIKKMKEIYPDLDETYFTNRFRLFMQMMDIVYKSERDSDKIAAFNTIMSYAGESPDITLMKQMQEMKETQYEDDPFSKSIKDRLKKG